MRTEKEINLYKYMGEAFERSDWTSVKYYNRLLADAELAMKREIFLHKPRVIQVELTGKCNARCVMCSHYYEHNDLGKHLSPEGFSLLKKGLPYTELVLLNGYGEPLISPIFQEILELLAQYDVKAMMTTNLSVLTEEQLKIIPQIFETIQISCNGVDEASYEEIHRGLSFSRFVKNLDSLVAAMDPHKLSLSCVAMVRTIPNAVSMVEFAAEHGIPAVRFGRLGISSFIRNMDQDPVGYLQGTAYVFSMAEKKAADLGISLTYPQNYRILLDIDQAVQELEQMKKVTFRYGSETENELRREFHSYLKSGGYLDHVDVLNHSPIACEGICDWVAEGIFIDSDGTLYPCCESKFLSYEGRYSGIAAQKLRREFYQGQLPDFCKNCPFVTNGELKRLKCFVTGDLYRSPYYTDGEQNDI